MKVAFYTLGCKVNQYETDVMMKKFSDNDFDIVDFEDVSDIYVVNSCSVTNLSTRKTRQVLSKAKKNGGIVVLCGCYAQEIKDKYTSLANVDIIIGNEEKEQIVDIVNEYRKNGNNSDVVIKVSDIGEVKKYSGTELLQKGINVRESVKIEDGCNNFCSYCIIPYVRGRVRSRSIDDIILEIENLVEELNYKIQIALSNGKLLDAEDLQFKINELENELMDMGY